MAGSWETEVTGPLGFTIERHDEWRALRGVPSGRLELATALLSHGADPNARLVTAPPRAGFSATDMRRLEGVTPFWLAAMAADVDMLRRLAEHGADPTLATTHDSAPPSAVARPRIHRDTTPLMVAAGVARNLAESMVTNEEALAAVKLLAELGGDANAANTAGDTALHGAAHTRSDALVQFLVDEGAGVSAANALGETPLIVAERYIHPGGAPVISRTSTGDLLRALGAR